MRTPASSPAFDFEDQRFDHGDVVLAAIAWGEWERLERSLAEGLACEAQAERDGEQVDAEELHAAVVAFRRSRRLLAGEEYLSWLADRALTTADVVAHLTREALRRRARGRLEQALSGDEPTADHLEQAIDAEAVVSGRLRSWSERLARSAAAKRGLPSRREEGSTQDRQELDRLVAAAARIHTSGLAAADVHTRAPRIAELIASESAFRAAVATPDLIERRLAEHRLDWQRLVWNDAAFRSEGAAREAALMVREDGASLDAAAALAHADRHVREAYVSEVPEIANLLLAASPGELVGPFQSDGGWRLACLRERSAVSDDDSALRERVTRELVEDALARHLLGRVCWHVKG